MANKSSMPPEVGRVILARLSAGEDNATAILRFCERQGLFPDGAPDERTFRDWVKKLRPKDPSAPWSLAGADPEEARLVLEVLAEAADKTEGRVSLTRELAGWIVRVRTASPDIPPRIAYAFAVAYRDQTAANRDAGDLDALLGAGPWRPGVDLDAIERRLPEAEAGGPERNVFDLAVQANAAARQSFPDGIDIAGFFAAAGVG